MFLTFSLSQMLLELISRVRSQKFTDLRKNKQNITKRWNYYYINVFLIVFMKSKRNQNSIAKMLYRNKR